MKSITSIAGGNSNSRDISLGNRPVVPSRVTASNRNVQLILSSLEKIKKIARGGNVTNLHVKFEEIIFFLLDALKVFLMEDSFYDV